MAKNNHVRILAWIGYEAFTLESSEYVLYKLQNPMLNAK